MSSKIYDNIIIINIIMNYINIRIKYVENIWLFDYLLRYGKIILNEKLLIYKKLFKKNIWEKFKENIYL